MQKGSLLRVEAGSGNLGGRRHLEHSSRDAVWEFKPNLELNMQGTSKAARRASINTKVSEGRENGGYTEVLYAFFTLIFTSKTSLALAFLTGLQDLGFLKAGHLPSHSLAKEDTNEFMGLDGMHLQMQRELSDSEGYSSEPENDHTN